MQTAWTEFVTAFGRYGHIDTTPKNWSNQLLFGWRPQVLNIDQPYRIDSVDLDHDHCRIVVTSLLQRRHPITGTLRYDHIADIYLSQRVVELNLRLLGSGYLRDNWMRVLPPDENKGRDARYLLDGKYSIRLAHGLVKFPKK